MITGADILLVQYAMTFALAVVATLTVLRFSAWRGREDPRARRRIRRKLRQGLEPVLGLALALKRSRDLLVRMVVDNACEPETLLRAVNREILWWRRTLKFLKITGPVCLSLGLLGTVLSMRWGLPLADAQRQLLLTHLALALDTTAWGAGFAVVSKLCHTCFEHWSEDTMDALEETREAVESHIHCQEA